MIVLGVLAVVAGYVNTPWFGSFLGDWLVDGNEALGHGHMEGTSLDYDRSNRRFLSWEFTLPGSSTASVRLSRNWLSGNRRYACTRFYITNIT